MLGAQAPLPALPLPLPGPGQVCLVLVGRMHPLQASEQLPALPGLLGAAPCCQQVGRYLLRGGR